MVSLISNNYNYNEAVTQLYTAGSVAQLAKTAVKEYLKDNDTKDIKNFINFNNDDSEQTITDLLKNYAQNTSEYIKSLNNNTDKLSKSDYQKVGMGGYYDAQSALQMSKAITAYTANKVSNNNTPTNTFNIGV